MKCLMEHLTEVSLGNWWKLTQSWGDIHLPAASVPWWGGPAAHKDTASPGPPAQDSAGQASEVSSPVTPLTTEQSHHSMTFLSKNNLLTHKHTGAPLQTINQCAHAVYSTGPRKDGWWGLKGSGQWAVRSRSLQGALLRGELETPQNAAWTLLKSVMLGLTFKSFMVTVGLTERLRYPHCHGSDRLCYITPILLIRSR